MWFKKKKTLACKPHLFATVSSSEIFLVFSFLFFKNFFFEPLYWLVVAGVEGEVKVVPSVLWQDVYSSHKENKFWEGQGIFQVP